MGPATTAVLDIAGGVVGAWGNIEQGNAEQNAYNYNAQVAKQNAYVASQNARLAGESGTATAAAVSLKNRAVYGTTKAQQGASGLDVNSGSAVDVRASEKELGGIDAYNSRVQAVREAYGYQVQSKNDLAESQLDVFQGKQAEIASEFGAATTLIGSLAQAGDQFSSWQSVAGGMTGG